MGDAGLEEGRAYLKHKFKITTGLTLHCMRFYVTENEQKNDSVTRQKKHS